MGNLFSCNRRANWDSEKREELPPLPPLWIIKEKGLATESLLIRACSVPALSRRNRLFPLASISEILWNIDHELFGNIEYDKPSLRLAVLKIIAINRYRAQSSDSLNQCKRYKKKCDTFSEVERQKGKLVNKERERLIKAAKAKAKAQGSPTPSQAKAAAAAKAKAKSKTKTLSKAKAKVQPINFQVPGHNARFRVGTTPTIVD